MDSLKFIGYLLKSIIFVLIISLAFVLGQSFSLDYSFDGFQIPLSLGLQRDISSPSDHIANENILFYQDKVVLKIKDATYSQFADTKSMDPLLDSNSIGIEIKPTEEEQIQVGDIIAYKSNKGFIIIHRVVDINSDNKGTYYITKGDNNLFSDNEKIRFEQIEGLLIGVLY